MAGISVDGLENFGTALWITFFTIIGTLIGTAFTIYKHFTTQRDNKRLGLIKQIEHYEKALYEIVNRYHNSKYELNDCKICADHTLVVLDKISYLRKKKLLDQDTIEYFRFWFSVGEATLNWYAKIEERELKSNFPYFIEVNNSIKNKAPNYNLDEHFKNFLALKNKN